MDLHDGTPFWPRRDGILGVHPRLTADVRCDVCVVGAGITGALIALELTKRGLDVVVVDRRDIGGGSTSASTAMLQYEIDELLIDLTAALGVERAAPAYTECGRGIELVERATQAVGRELRVPPISERVHGDPHGATSRRLRDECDARRGGRVRRAMARPSDAARAMGLDGTGGDRVGARGIRRPVRARASTPSRRSAERGGRVFERTEVSRLRVLRPSGSGHHRRGHGHRSARGDGDRIRSVGAAPEAPVQPAQLVRAS